jgi:uncharacterized protein YeaO (DUF488 family)
MIATKRVYDLYTRRDAHRVLVDRLWPRGRSKAEAPVGCGAREIAHRCLT